ncbi:MAG TPA: malto-oligosyltrehalose trehalohydrolase [Phycisphaerales bacterium]|nr:malto-oligosyltrehalose trehalohydrolase [Phycisphaerales bacterium]
MTPHLPPIGAFPLDARRTRFTLWAPLHERMGLRLAGADRPLPMAPDADGYHTLDADAPPGTRYQFEFADGRLRPDPASLAQPDGVHGPSQVVARPFGAPPAPFANPPLAQHVFYELHAGAFTPEGTFDAVIPRLGALRDLGVTAIELMPIGQFPGARNWGYDGVSLFAAHSAYGGLHGLLRLVSACHAQGMAIFLDAVYNHLGPEGNYLGEFGPYFTDRYKTPWGAALNFDGPGSDHVREFFIQNSLFWTRDCGLDGLRLDAVHAIVDHSASTFIEELAARNHAAAENAGRRILVIAESSDNDPKLVRPRTIGGLGLDGCWNDDYHHAIRAALTGDRRGYYKPFGVGGGGAQIAKAINDRFVFAGEYSSGYGRRHGAPARDIDHARLIVFTQNHDQVGNRPLGDRLDATAGLDGARTAAALVLLSPFTPMLWMGEEYAEPAPFQYFVSHTDPDLIEAVRRGRKQEFAEFHAAGDAPDPQDEATLRRSTLDWSLREHPSHAKTLAYYTELLRLRRALDIPARASTASAAAHGPVVRLTYAGNPSILICANTGAHPAGAPLDHPGPFECLLDSTDPRWGGDRTPTRPTGPFARECMLAPRSVLVLRAAKENQ